MNKSILELIAQVIGRFELLPDVGPGHPPAETVWVTVAVLNTMTPIAKHVSVQVA